MRTLIALLALAALFATPAEADRRRESAPAAGALQVVDSNNEVVGQFTVYGCFVRHVDGYWVDICGVQADGTTTNESLSTRFFLEPGCQGTPFVESFTGAALSRVASAGHGHFEFVGDPVTVISVVSWQYQNSPSSDNTWTCVNNEEDLGDGSFFPVFDVRAGPLHSLPLSTLGTPPFRIRTSP